MNPPYILVDDGDITLFQSVAALEKYVESPDIEGYSVFDSCGMRLKFEDIPKKLEGKRKIAIVRVVPVRLRVNETNEIDDGALSLYLRTFLASVTDESLDRVELPDLLKRVQDVTGVMD